MTTETEIERDLESSDPEVRRRATSNIPDLPSHDAVGYVVRALGDADWRVRKEAGQVALLLGPVPSLLDGLVAQLFPGENVGLRNAVVETLASFGSKAVPPVVRALPELDADGKKLAAEILGRAEDPAGLPALERLLSDVDANVRTAAVEAIGDLGVLAVDAASRILLSALEAGDLHMRLAALEGLNGIGVVIPWYKLRPLTSDPILRRAALAASSRTGHVEAAEQLARALSDPSPAIFRLALLGLAELVLGMEGPVSALSERIAKLESRARERLLEALAPPLTDEAVRRAALVVAAALNEPAAIDVVIDSLIDDRTAREADAALRLFGPSALPRILARVAHGDPVLRAAATGRLAALVDSQSQDAVRIALRAAVADPSDEVSSAALAALADLGGPEDVACVFAAVAAKQHTALAAARAALTALARRFPEDARMIASVARRDQSSQIATATVIGALGGGVLGGVVQDVTFLSGVLSSPDPATRLSAVEAVAEVGSDLGMDTVQFALADEEREVQLCAVRALGRLRTGDGKAAGGDRLVDLTQSSGDSELVAAAARALGTTGDPRAPESLRPLAHSASPLIAVAAVETLGRLEAPGRIDTLLEVTRHSHAEVVKAALLALERIDDPRALDHLGAALAHEAWDVRRLAADCLGRFGGEEAARLLRDKLGKEPEPLVREALSRALSTIEAPSTARRPATIAPPKAES